MITSKKRFIFAVIAASIWMNLNEFIRNDLLLKQTWIEGFNKLGLNFPMEPINAAVWVLWVIIFAILLTWLVSRLGALTSTLVAWSLSYVLLWIAMWNMGVLPEGILQWAIPWSLFEVYVAAMISARILNNSR